MKKCKSTSARKTRSGNGASRCVQRMVRQIRDLAEQARMMGEIAETAPSGEYLGKGIVDWGNAVDYLHMAANVLPNAGGQR